ncbi:MAG: hypothetical protein AAGU11_17195 [Syntrophobacteraceae bacterium]
MAFDPNSPAVNHSGETDCDQIRENLNQLRKVEDSASDPPSPVAGMLQVYRGGANPVLRQRNKDNTGWIYLWDLVAQKLLIDADTIDGKHADELGVQAASVGTGHLKTAMGNVSGSSGHYILPGGLYSFYPQVRGMGVYAQIANGRNTAGSYVTSIYLSSGETVYARNQYVTASGTERWIFLLVNIATGEVLAGYDAPDHPCCGNGDDPREVPHPFVEYLDTTVPENLEIVLLDMQSSRAILADAIGGPGALNLLHDGVWRVDTASDLPFTPRDMDGHRTLEQKHASYRVRRAVRS